MDKKFGIKETTEAVVLGCRIADAVDKSLSDGEVSAWDARHFIDVLPSVKTGINGYQLLGKELGELDTEERKQLMDTIAKELDLDNGDAKDALEIVVGIVAFASKIRTRRAAKKAAQEAVQEEVEA